MVEIGRSADADRGIETFFEKVNHPVAQDEFNRNVGIFLHETNDRGSQAVRSERN